MVEMQSACFCTRGSTLKPCLTTVTPSGPPSVGMPSWLIHDRNGYSLPKNQTPSVLPRKSSGLVMPVSLRQRSEEHTSELQSRQYLVRRLLLEKNSILLHYRHSTITQALL